MQILPYFEWVNTPLAPKQNIGKLHISTGRVVSCGQLRSGLFGVLRTRFGGCNGTNG